MRVAEAGRQDAVLGLGGGGVEVADHEKPVARRHRRFDAASNRRYVRVAVRGVVGQWDPNRRDCVQLRRVGMGVDHADGSLGSGHGQVQDGRTRQGDHVGDWVAAQDGHAPRSPSWSHYPVWVEARDVPVVLDGCGGIRLHFLQGDEIRGHSLQLGGLVGRRAGSGLNVPAHDRQIVARGGAPGQRNPLRAKEAAAQDHADKERGEKRAGTAPQRNRRQDGDHGQEQQLLEGHDHGRHAVARRKNRGRGSPDSQRAGDQGEPVDPGAEDGPQEVPARSESHRPIPDVSPMVGAVYGKRPEPLHYGPP